MATTTTGEAAHAGRADFGPALGPKSALPHGTRWALALLVIMLGMTGFAYALVEGDHDRHDQRRFEFRTNEIRDAIQTRMAAYIGVLRGGQGLFNASRTVTRAEWRTYVEAIDIDTFLPGIQGIGYAEFVKQEQRAAYEAKIRSEGFPDFQVRPEGDRALYSSITFLEPFDERNRQAFGFDMYQQETRRDAMDRARDSGMTAISGKVTLVQEISDEVQAGFLMYLPYFGPGGVPIDQETRRQNIEGYVYSPFRMNDLMEGILGVGLPDVRLEIFDSVDTSSAGLMFDSLKREEVGRLPQFSTTQPLELGQHRWTLRISSLPEFQADGGSEGPLILAGGLALSFLVFGILWSFATTRERAQELARSMTLKLRESTEELERSNTELELFAYVASHDLKAPLRGIDHLASWIESDLGDALTGEPKQNMGLLRGRIKRLEVLLDDLLDYSRAGRKESKRESIAIEATAKEWFDSLNAEGHFTLHLAVEAPVLRLAVVSLEQVLTNLFTNTMKHHGENIGNIYLRVFETPGFYEFHYEDDGVGIPAEKRDRAFQMFQTLQPRDQVEGSGMGMAIIRKIVEREGGSIDCLDRPNGARGVFFHVRWKKG